MDDLTQILRAVETGDREAPDKLLALVYQELRQLAAAKLAQEKPGQTLQATALVHETYLRLFAGRADSATNAAVAATGPWQSRRHFFAAAAESMRRVLVEQARRKGRIKRGGDRARVDLEVAELSVDPPSDDILAIDEALQRLAAIDQSKADVVKLRFFAGLSIEDTAAALGISTPTVKRYWFYARAWLLREMSKGDESD